MNLKFWTKLREPKARKDEVRDFYESWVKETEAIRGTLDKGMKSHQKVFMFDLYDGNRMRVLTLRMVGPRKIDDEFRTIQVSFQGVVGPCMTKYHKAYNRLIALSRLVTNHSVFSFKSRVCVTIRTMALSERVREAISSNFEPKPLL